MKADFVSAALRHVSDAEHLLSRSPDQSWHLAGFAHECARKACVQDSWVPKVLGHDFSGAAESVIELAIALDPRAGRMPTRDWAKQFKTVLQWSAEHRYEKTGSCAKRPVKFLVSDAREALTAVLVALTLEGDLRPESLS